MRKTICITIWILTISLASQSFAISPNSIQYANFLAEKWVINNNSGNTENYNLWNQITRREMLKVMMNLSWEVVVDECNGDFSDMNGDDWGCKYAEAALRNGFISANTIFRPNDNVTQIESLKMVMQAKGIKRDANDDWRAWYASKWQSVGIIEESYIDFDKNGLRAWIFWNAARSYSDFVLSEEDFDAEINQEIDKIFETILWL